jgi:hypothetical protein
MATRRRITAEDVQQRPAGPDLSGLSEDERATWQMPLTTTGAQALAEVEDEPEETATDRVQRMLTELAGDERAVVKLYRIDKTTNKQAWCEDYRPADFEQGGHAMIRQQWGPGVFLVKLYGQVHGKAGKPGFGILATSEITVAPRLDVPAPAGASGDMAQVLRALTENQAAFQQQVLQQLADRPAPVDPMQQMQQMLTMMTLMRQAMGVDSQQPRSQIGEIVAAVRELRGVAAELIPGKAEDDDSASSLLGQVVSAVKTVAPLVQARQAMGALPAPVMLPPSMQANDAPPLHLVPTPTPAAPHEAPTSTDNTDHTTDPDEQMRLAAIFQLKSALAPLLALAAANAPIDQGVDFLCDHLPDDVADFVEHPECIAVLMQLAPEAAPHQAWLTQVREAYMALPEEDDAPAPGAGAVPPPAAA